MPTRSRALCAAVTICTAVALAPAGGAARAARSAEGATVAAASTPAVSVRTLSSALVFPWDTAPMPNGGALLGLRGGGFRYVDPSGAVHTVAADTADVYTKSGAEAGQAGVVLDPGFSASRRFFVCQSHKSSNGTPIDIRVVVRTLSPDNTSASPATAILIGIPLSSNALHTGCRLRFAPDGTLHVGTGDAFTGPAPQDLNSLAGKTLRINPDGTVPADNPFAGQGGNAAKVYTYGHRNVQGLSLRPGTAEMWNVEHGPSTDDEVNRLASGANYGWAPVKGGSTAYDQSVPMTDLARFPAAVPARWRSGTPTVAPSGSTFLTGSRWGRWEGALAFAELKNEGVRAVMMTPDGRVTGTEQIPQLDNVYGRMRAVESVPAGNALYAVTSNGSQDRVLRVTATTAQPKYIHGADPSPSGVAVVARGSTLVGFVRGTSGAIYSTTQQQPGGRWSGFTRIPGAVASAPAAVSWDGSRIDLFARGTNGHLVHTWSTGGSFRAWQDRGGVISSAPTAASLADGSIDVFARAGTKDALYRIRYSGGQWSSWTNAGGVLAAAPAATANRVTGHITVYARGSDGRLCLLDATASTARWQSCGAGGRETWTAPAAGAGPDPVVLTRGADLTPVVAAGGLVTAVGGRITGATGVATRAGGYTVLGRGTDNALWAYDGRPGQYRWSKVGGELR